MRKIQITQRKTDCFKAKRTSEGNEKEVGSQKKKQQTENHIPCRIVDRSKEHEPVVK
jgi:hypothetical protein